MRTVDFHYIDAAGAEQAEIVTLNGVTPVNTVATDIRFVQSIHSETVGSGGVAAGNISIYKTGAAATVYNLIKAGGNVSLNTARMVPVNKTLYISNITVSGTSGKPISVRLRITSTHEDTLTNGLFFQFKRTYFIQDSTVAEIISPPLKAPALSIVKMTAYSTTAGGDMATTYNGWVE